MKQQKQAVSIVTFFALVFSLLAPFFLIEKAEAAGLQQAYVRLNRMAASTPTTGTVCAKTAVTDVTESNVAVTFPSAFILGLAATFTVDNTTNLPNGSIGWLGIGTATSVTGQVVTFPSTDLAANTLYCFNWLLTIAVQTGTSGNSQTGTIASGGNSTTFSVAVLTTSDQIGVTATVPPTFSFSLSGVTDTFASALSTTAQLSNGVTASITTNAAAGWIVWVKSANAALNSASTGATIPTYGTLNNTAETLTGVNYGYLLDVTFSDSATAGTGTVTQGANYGQEYDGNSSNTGGTLSTSFQPVASASGSTDGDSVTLKELARVSAIQAAATDYTDTLTVVAAGRF